MATYNAGHGLRQGLFPVVICSDNGSKTVATGTDGYCSCVSDAFDEKREHNDLIDFAKPNFTVPFIGNR